MSRSFLANKIQKGKIIRIKHCNSQKNEVYFQIFDQIIVNLELGFKIKGIGNQAQSRLSIDKAMYKQNLD